MTVKELKEALNNFEDDMDVAIPTMLPDKVAKFYDYASVEELRFVVTDDANIVVLCNEE